jgi:hypothetical protein
VDFVNIDRAIATALGALATPNFLDFLFQYFGRYTLRKVEDKGIVPASDVAKSLRTLCHSTHDYSGAAICALGHRLVRLTVDFYGSMSNPIS